MDTNGALLQDVFSMDGFREWLRDQGRSEGTVEKHTTTARKVLRAFGTHEVAAFRRQHAIKFIRENEYAQSTRSHMHAGLRAMFQYLAECGLAPPGDIFGGWQPRTPRFQKPIGQVTNEQIDEMLDHPAINEQEKAIIQFLRETGARGAAASLMETEDIFQAPDGWTMVRVLQMKTGGAAVKRDMVISPYLKQLLEDWMRVKPYPTKYLWQWFETDPPTKPIRSFVWGIIRNSVAKVFGEDSREYHEINPHAFRYTYAQSLDADGASLAEIQRLLGHVSILTTRRYLIITEDRARAAQKRFLQQFRPVGQSSKEFASSENRRWGQCRYKIFMQHPDLDGSLQERRIVAGWKHMLAALRNFERFREFAEGERPKSPKIRGYEVPAVRDAEVLTLEDEAMKETLRVWRRHPDVYT